METQTEVKPSGFRTIVKGVVIFITILVLQIPAYYVQNLVEERESRQREAITEVSGKWAQAQTIAGPMLVLPFWEMADTDKGRIRVKQIAHFLPDELNIQSTATPQEKHRGIYKVILYSSRSNVSGKYNRVDLTKLNIPLENVIWNEAYVQVSISDQKGLNEELSMKWNNQNLVLSPSDVEKGNSLTAPLTIDSASLEQPISFSFDLNLNGSQELMFAPVGKATTVQVKSSWPHPSFQGDILPDAKKVSGAGFTAQWKSPAFKRSFPQQWKGRFSLMSNDNFATTATNTAEVRLSSFGTSFYMPVNAYQKTLRSVKYCLLCIVLTFAFFYIIENSSRKNVHPLHYGLIGVALVLFYTLLLSISEYFGFNIAYLISSVATIALIAWFINALTSSRISMILTAVMTLTYTYIFTILQLQDYALLFGSIGLFITLFVIMYFSRRLRA